MRRRNEHWQRKRICRTSDFYFPIPFIIHIRRLRRSQKKPSPSFSKKARLRCRRQSQSRHFTLDTGDPSPQTPATLQLVIATLQTPTTLQLAFDRDDSNVGYPSVLDREDSDSGDPSALTGDTSVPITMLQFQSRRFSSDRDNSTLNRQRHFILHNIRSRRFTLIATLQLSIAGGASSFTTSDNASVRDAFGFLFCLFFLFEICSLC